MGVAVAVVVVAGAGAVAGAEAIAAVAVGFGRGVVGSVAEAGAIAAGAVGIGRGLVGSGQLDRRWPDAAERDRGDDLYPDHRHMRYLCPCPLSPDRPRSIAAALQSNNHHQHNHWPAHDGVAVAVEAPLCAALLRPTCRVIMEPGAVDIAVMSGRLWCAAIRSGFPVGLITPVAPACTGGNESVSHSTAQRSFFLHLHLAPLCPHRALKNVSRQHWVVEHDTNFGEK